MSDDKVIDLQKIRDERYGPDAEWVWIDEKGVKWFTYLVDYKIDDAEFGFRIMATSMEDAERRVMALRASATLAGCLHSEITA